MLQNDGFIACQNINQNSFYQIESLMVYSSFLNYMFLEISRLLYKKNFKTFLPVFEVNLEEIKCIFVLH